MRINELRSIKMVRHYTCHAEGSVLIEMGNTKVLCNATIINGVPRFLKDTGEGWITAEYGMLPRATGTRVDREACKGKQTGRTQEIQRLIGRALRSGVNLRELGEITVVCDCDVLQADGGTRVASITGASVALIDAISKIRGDRFGEAKFPVKHLVAAISVGIQDDQVWLDLNYAEDSTVGADLNVVMLDNGQFVELQGTAERQPFSRDTYFKAIEIAAQGINKLIEYQKAILEL